MQGPNDYTIAQIKDAVRDGLRAVKNVLEDKAVVPGAGAFEVAAAHHLRSVAVKGVEGRWGGAGVVGFGVGVVVVVPCGGAGQGAPAGEEALAQELLGGVSVMHPSSPPIPSASFCRAKLGVEAFAEALLGIPKILAANGGFDPQEVIISLQVCVCARCLGVLAVSCSRVPGGHHRWGAPGPLIAATLAATLGAAPPLLLLPPSLLPPSLLPLLLAPSSLLLLLPPSLLSPSLLLLPPPHCCHCCHGLAQEEYERSGGAVGVDVATGEPMDPHLAGGPGGAGSLAGWLAGWVGGGWG